MNLSLTVKRMTVAIAVAAVVCSCHHIDNKRLPLMPVNLVFYTQADWVTYGVPAATDHRRFILSERIPANFPYKATSATGYGGILLCATYTGEPVAYDLACPVECSATVRVYVNDDMLAECPKCHSTYDIFSLLGTSLSGPAAEYGYGLQVYRCSAGGLGEYMVVSH